MADVFDFGAPPSASQEPDADKTTPLPGDLPGVGELIADAGDVRAWVDTTPPPREWIIRDLVPAGEIGRLVAPGGTGKSMALLQLAVSVASGGVDWLGYPPGQGASRVLVLSAEDDRAELHRRFYAIGQGLNADGVVLNHAALRNIVTLSVRGMDLRLIATTDAGGAGRDKGRVEWLCRVIEQTEARLVILDPQASFYGGEENSNKDAQVWIDGLRHVTERTGCTLLIVHHANKASMNGVSDGGTAARGASAFRDGCRFELNLAGMTDKEAKVYGIDPENRSRYVKLTMPKANYAPPFPGAWLERGQGGYLRRSDIQPIPKASKADSPKLQATIVDLIRDEATQKRWHSRTGLAKRKGHCFDAGRDTVTDAINAMIDAGELVEIPLPDKAEKSAHRNVRRVLAVSSTD